MLSESVFKMFDADNSGLMDFPEYLQVSNLCKLLISLLFSQARLAMELRTPEEKLAWIFTLFDSDGGGEIEVSGRDELNGQANVKILFIHLTRIMKPVNYLGCIALKI